MKIILITPVYPSKSAPAGSTPVVHYFTREWVKMGHEVTVFHLEVSYPFFVLWLTRLFEKRIYSKIGFPAPTKKPKPYNEVLDGVEVHHLPIKKIIRADRFKKKYVDECFQKILSFCKQNRTPDLFIGHWDSPQIEILNMLKAVYPNVNNAIVFHSLNRDLRKSYKEDFERLFSGIDNFGFRSEVALQTFSNRYFVPRHTFIAASGINEIFIRNYSEKTFDEGIKNFVYVGALIKRKHPAEVLEAISEVFQKEQYHITYIGEGAEKDAILEAVKDTGDYGEVTFTGRIDRTQVVNHYRDNDVFVMISDKETFGLVYLEAMAMGCITIASVGGGIDGIIQDGINGFLCKSGDKGDLARIIRMIKRLPVEELRKISLNGVETARKFSDSKVAAIYLNSIVK